MTDEELWDEIIEEIVEGDDFLCECESICEDEIGCFDKEKTDILKRILLFKQNVDEIYFGLGKIKDELYEDYSELECTNPEDLDQEYQKYFVELIDTLKQYLNGWEKSIDRAISLCDSYKNDDITKDKEYSLEEDFLRKKDQLLKIKGLYKTLSLE